MRGEGQPQTHRNRLLNLHVLLFLLLVVSIHRMPMPISSILKERFLRLPQPQAQARVLEGEREAQAAGPDEGLDEVHERGVPRRAAGAAGGGGARHDDAIGYRLLRNARAARCLSLDMTIAR